MLRIETVLNRKLNAGATARALARDGAEDNRPALPASPHVTHQVFLDAEPALLTQSLLREAMEISRIAPQESVRPASVL